MELDRPRRRNDDAHHVGAGAEILGDLIEDVRPTIRR
jgi:hypothetical protein